LKKTIQDHIDTLETSFNLIATKRQTLLQNCAHSISKQLTEKSSSEIIVICTHNSRRSQLAELWITLASMHYKLNSISSFSGGSESTAFNHRMVNALIDFGLEFNLKQAGKNPQYIVTIDEEKHKQHCFSKIYNHSFNPQKDFIAILVCHSADEACPTIFGAAERFFVPYVDPKRADDTDEEKSAYADKVMEIGREMLYMMSKVKVE